MLMISGCIFDSDSDKKSDAVKKGSVSGTVVMTITRTPLSNVKVYLINKAVKADTVNYANNAKAFVDSAYTDSEGKYVIGDIAPGNYAVAPLNGDAASVLKFSIVAGSDSCEFAMNGETRTTNFIAEKVDYPGAGGSTIGIDIGVYADNTKHQITKFTISRRKWIACFPYYDFSIETTISQFPLSIYNYSYSCDRGYTAVLFTLDNYFRCTVEYRDFADNALRTQTFDIGFPLGDTPDSSEWKYVITTRTLTRSQ